MNESSFAQLANTAIVYPIILDNRIEVLIEVEGQVLRAEPTEIDRVAVKETIRKLSLALRNDLVGNTYSDLAGDVYEWVIRPTRQALDSVWEASTEMQEKPTLVFVPEGALRTIPFAALYDRLESKFLVQQYTISITPTIGAVGGNGIDAERGKLLLGGLAKKSQGFPALTNVSRELEAISELRSSLSAEASVGSQLTPILKNKNFTLKELKEELGSDEVSMAHLATHGKFSSDYRKSFLLTDDGQLTLDELRKTLEAREQPLDLLVLSACETAKNDEDPVRAALGIAGIAVQSGARTALASLWAVNDAATADLMKDFYNSWWTKNLSKAESLAHAQRKLIASPRRNHPKHWAPFVLIGDWR